MWTCSNCREKLEDTFDICWSCGTAKDGRADPEFSPEPEDPDVPDPGPDVAEKAVPTPPSIPYVGGAAYTEPQVRSQVSMLLAEAKIEELAVRINRTEAQLAALATKRELLRAGQLTAAGEQLLAQVDELMTGNRQTIGANPVAKCFHATILPQTQQLLVILRPAGLSQVFAQADDFYELGIIGKRADNRRAPIALGLAARFSLEPVHFPLQFFQPFLDCSAHRSRPSRNRVLASARMEVPDPVNLEARIRHVHARHFLFSSQVSAELTSSLSLGLIV